jgi:hypothetical protein
MERKMETIKTASRIHPLMATAAVSVILVSLVGTAAITGMIPSSNAIPAPSAVPPSAMVAAAAPGMQPMAALPAQAQFQPALAQAQFQPVAAPPAAIQYQPPGATAPVTYVPAVAKAEPAPKAQPKPRTRTVEKVVYRDRYVQAPQRTYATAPAPAPVAKQPNYMAMGLGAVVGGLAGNQIGDGNGRKAATVAGVIGGAMLGNHIANRQQQQ